MTRRNWVLFRKSKREKRRRRKPIALCWLLGVCDRVARVRVLKKKQFYDWREPIWISLLLFRTSFPFVLSEVRLWGYWLIFALCRYFSLAETFLLYCLFSLTPRSVCFDIFFLCVLFCQSQNDTQTLFLFRLGLLFFCIWPQNWSNFNRLLPTIRPRDDDLSTVFVFGTFFFLVTLCFFKNCHSFLVMLGSKTKGLLSRQDNYLVNSHWLTFHSSQLHFALYSFIFSSKYFWTFFSKQTTLFQWMPTIPLIPTIFQRQFYIITQHF